jgi:TrmH family RNA methyltransferase
VFHVPVEIDVALSSLAGRFERIACLDLTGAPIATPDFRARDCYLFGNEARGLPPDAAAMLDARAFTIAGAGAIDSLNFAGTVNICLYQLNRAI